MFILDAVGMYVVELMQEALVTYGMKDSRLYSQIKYSIDTTNLVLSFELPAYSEWVEKGRRPFGNESPFPVNMPPPLGPIIEWIRRKRIQGRDKKGRFITVNSLAWAIRTMISKRGIKPRPFISDAITTAEPELNKYFATTFDLIVDDSLKKLVG